MQIRSNKIKCLHCGDTIESLTVHDYRHCKCGKVSVDGGREYLKRGFPADGGGNGVDYKDLSITVIGVEEK